ncbi:MAG: DNA-binding protein [Pelovirga sp.]
MTALLFGCQQSDTSSSTAAPQAAVTPSPAATPAKAANTSGVVIETINAQGYTYVQVDSDGEKIWAATPQFAVSEGDMVVIPEGMPMHNYYSQSLEREFEVVYFVESILNASTASASTASPSQAQMPEGHPPISGAAAPAQVELTDVVKLDDGMSIEEIYAARGDLSGKEVKLRGKVVKFSPQIMGTNWIHLQDGSGSADAGTHDLTVTTGEQLKVGDIVVASGAVTLDKDFGHGYFYDLIIENAVVAVE